jgi:uncharacterized membrane protein
MPVFREEHCDGVRFTVRPNCALSWRSTKALFAFFALCLGAVTAYFAAIGAWLVLPFAGLELAVLGLGLYLSSLAGHRREVIQVEDLVLRVLHGGRQLREVVALPRQWTRVQLRRDPRGWYPSRLVLSGGGNRVEIGLCLTDAEREALAAELRVWVGCDAGAQPPFDLPSGLSLAAPREAVEGSSLRWLGIPMPAPLSLALSGDEINKRSAQGAFLQQ